MTVYVISTASACGNIRPRSLENSRSLPTCTAASPIQRDLSQFVDTVLRLLDVGGSFYTLASGVRLEDGKDKLGTLYLTELEDAFGRGVKVCSWLKKISLRASHLRVED